MSQQRYEINRTYVEKLFVHVYSDLAYRLQVKDEFLLYHRLNSARLIRQLLIDGNGLMSHANRPYRLKLFFCVKKIGEAPEWCPEIPKEVYSCTPHWLDMPPGMYLHPLSLDTFLNHVVMNLGGREIKVSEVIRYVANSYGGVHLAPYVSSEDEILFERFNNKLNFGGENLFFSCIRWITEVVLCSLLPLRTAITDRFKEIAEAEGLEGPPAVMTYFTTSEGEAYEFTPHSCEDGKAIGSVIIQGGMNKGMTTMISQILTNSKRKINAERPEKLVTNRGPIIRPKKGH